MLEIHKILRLDYPKAFVTFLTGRLPVSRRDSKLAHFELKSNQHIEGTVTIPFLVRNPDFVK